MLDESLSSREPANEREFSLVTNWHSFSVGERVGELKTFVTRPNIGLMI